MRKPSRMNFQVGDEVKVRATYFDNAKDVVSEELWWSVSRFGSFCTLGTR